MRGRRAGLILPVLAGALAAAAVASGCASDAVTVLKSSGPPSALAGARRVAISFNYSRFRVGGVSEAEFIQRRTEIEEPGFPARWRALKVAYERAFIEGFNAKWPPGSVIAFPSNDRVALVVVPSYIQLGRFTYVGTADRTSMAVAMGWLVRGAAVEEIQMMNWSSSSIFNASVVQHAGRLGRLMGEKAGRYLSSRQ